MIKGKGKFRFDVPVNVDKSSTWLPRVLCGGAAVVSSFPPLIECNKLCSSSIERSWIDGFLPSASASASGLLSASAEASGLGSGWASATASASGCGSGLGKGLASGSDFESLLVLISWLLNLSTMEAFRGSRLGSGVTRWGWW